MRAAHPAVLDPFQRHRWARALQRWAPDLCTVAGAADILGIDPHRLARALSRQVQGPPVTPQTRLTRAELVAALRHREPS